VLDSLIVPLDSSIDAKVFGSKAASLSKALRAGLPVPPGCALHPDLVSRIAQRTASENEYTVLERFLAPFMSGAAVVRSSAIGEDGTLASFAGQHRTSLNVHGFDGILTAIKSVWTSGQAESVRWYRMRMGIAGEPRMAVIVQQLIPAQVAGVLFTVDPLSGSNERWIIEASWGLGEAVVAGLVIPDRYVISREGELLERLLGRKCYALVPNEDGGTTESEIEDPAQVLGACLDEEALIHLAQMGMECECLFGVGQDIEWASAGRTLHLLQCRPVTYGRGRNEAI
jgi:pyruvate,water dikinase